MQFEAFKAAVIGEWRGTKQLYLAPPPEPAVSSPSRLSISPIAGGSFLQFTYDWTYEGAAQSGVLLFGFSDEQKAASAAWIDSFHMSTKIMFCNGTAADRSADLRGSYEAPPGPDWGWRITIRSVSATELQIVMHNISPEGQEDLAVQIDYTRSN
jgi:Protein of unknown function (DUF1579)